MGAQQVVPEHNLQGPHRDATGWTAIDPSLGSGACGGQQANYTGTCIYYVSNRGTDDPVHCRGYPPPVLKTPTTTCASLAYAISQTRTAKPDWVLLKKGDTFYPTRFAQVWAHGRSAQEPMLISAYPMEENTGPKPTIDFRKSVGVGAAIIATHPNSKYLAITGLKVINSGRDPSSLDFDLKSLAETGGALASLSAPFGWLLIEDCELQYVGAGYVIQGASKEIFFRRNAVIGVYPSTNNGDRTGERGSGGIGLYASDWQNLLIEDNLFYMNGWNKDLIAGSAITITDGTPALVTWENGLAAKRKTPGRRTCRYSY